MISKEELVATLYYTLFQITCDEKGYANSQCISSYAFAMELLAKLKLFEIDTKNGYCIEGRFL